MSRRLAALTTLVMVAGAGCATHGAVQAKPVASRLVVTDAQPSPLGILAPTASGATASGVQATPTLAGADPAQTQGGAPVAGATSGAAPGAAAAQPSASTADVVRTLKPQGSAAPVPRPTGPVDSAENTSPQGLIADNYGAWMTDLSGLYDNQSQPWLDAMAEVATPRLKQAAFGSTETLIKAQEHGVGTLVDSNRVITVTGSTATITDCLDEKDWYVVDNRTNQPDPGVTVGYYVGSATAVLTAGQWLIDNWNSHPQTCQPS